MEINNLQNKIGYNFKEVKFLKEALTHRSYINENPGWEYSHNERLEFLGDAVLELVTTEFLYGEYPKEPEGTLTSIRAALVNYLMLSQVAGEIELDSYMYLSRGEAKDTGRARAVILANAMEALIGAIYLDGGIEPVKDFTRQFVMARLPEIMKKRLYKDPKSMLQEIVQEKNKVTPNYEVVRETGPDHDKVFVVKVMAGEKKIGEGAGPSKQEAEVEAAKQALEKI